MSGSRPAGLRPCRKPYGPLSLICRRLDGHDDDCGQAIDEEELVVVAFLEARERVAHLVQQERLPHEITGELLMMVLK